MRPKVQEMFGLARQIPDVTVEILSGEEARNVERVLNGELIGSLTASD